MDAGAVSSTIPTPEAFAKARLRRAPQWLKSLVSNGLAILSWVGLPATFLSTLSNISWVVEGAIWLYRQAGAFRPVLTAVGEWITLVVHIWRSLTRPLWETLSGWLHIAVPAWVPDVLTLLFLFGVGIIRMRLYRERLEGRAKRGLPVLSKGEPGITEGDIPVVFDGYGYLESRKARLTDGQRREIERLWRRFRREACWSIFHAVMGGGKAKFRRSDLHEQFYTYWRASVGARQIMMVYGATGLLIAVALLIEWAL